MSERATALALAPIGHHWPRERVRAYYEEVATLPVSVVYLGESVCNKRSSMRLKDWLAVATTLDAAGKRVVLTSKPVIESAAELRMLERVMAKGPVTVEVNDAGLMASVRHDPGFVAGPYLNLYNAESVAAMAAMGARRWVAPAEMDRASLAALQGRLPAGIETEVLVFGRLPLAFSTQCYTARSYARLRRDCRLCCMQHPEGQKLASLDGRSLMVVNGPQTLSEPIYNLMGGLAELQRMGVALLRIDPPRGADTAQVVRIFEQALRGVLTEHEALAELTRVSPAAFCNGYWLGLTGSAYVPPAKSGDWPSSRSAVAYP